ncbi:unnamed protein product [Closterium sp. NIES-64]|nr:unnamed protein product [Closterium sp. NIES-64]
MYVPGVVKGLEECMGSGMLAGFPVVDVRATLIGTRMYVPGVVKGLEECMGSGVLAGFPVVDVRATLIGTYYHEVVTLIGTGLIPRGGLECAGVPAGGTRRVQVKEGMGKASPRLVEPVMKVEVVTPEDHMGDVIGDLNSRRGQINSFGDKPGGMKVVDALVPLSEMFNYVSNLRGMTKGRANYTMQLAQFDIVPTNIQNQITAKAQGTAV